MNIVLIAPRLPPHFDGVGDHGHALARTLASSGHDVRVLTAGAAPTPASYHLTILSTHWGWRATLAACRQVRTLRPDVVLMEYTPFLYGARSPAPLVIAAWTRLCRRQLTIIAHEIFHGAGSAAAGSNFKARYFAWRDRFVLSLARRIAVPNPQRRERITAQLPHLRDRIDLVPIAANVEPGLHYLRTARTGSLEIVLFGVVMTRRRYELAIRALACIPPSENARLTIVGRIFEQEYAEGCMALARSLGVESRVYFTGSVTNECVSGYLAAAHVAVHTAKEGSTRSSGSLLALLAHGVPVVAVRTVHDDPCFEDLLLYAGESPQALANAVVSLSRTPALAAALSKRSAAAYRSSFDWRALAHTLIASNSR